MSQVFADLHIHSPFAQGSSRELKLEHIALAARRKGLHVVGTGDWSHPKRWSELRAKLMPAEDGLFQLRPDLEQDILADLPPSLHNEPLRFLLSTEVSTVYEQEGQVRKIHHLLFAPDFARAQRIRSHLERFGDLSLDGRPTLSLTSRNLLEVILEASSRCHLIPAHVWSPWNGLFGTTYGFDSLKECYHDLSSHIFAIETGLSSVPTMSRSCSMLDRLALVSFSNTHAPSQIGREATAFPTPMQYDAFFEALKQKLPLETIEFYPEKGRYHLDGHRSCDIRCSPEESRALNMRCPVCHKPLTVGVLHRIRQLGDRTPEEAKRHTQSKFQQLISLPEILAEVLDTPLSSRRLLRHYDDLLEQFGSEFKILRELPTEDIQRSQIPLLSEAIQRVRAGALQITPGYDGEYGKVSIFKKDESKATTLSLFSWSNSPESDEDGHVHLEDDSHESDSWPPLSAQSGKQMNLFPTPPPPTEEVVRIDEPSPQVEEPLSSSGAFELPPLQREQQLSMSELFEGSVQTQHTPLAPPEKVATVTLSSIEPQAPLPALESPLPYTPLPPTSPTKAAKPAKKIPPPKQLLAGLNTEQRAAVLHRGSPILLVAGPGTGKTKTLIHRLAYQLACRKVMPQHAVYLTFSQEAAVEAQELLLTLIGPVARRVFVGTFQKFCLRILQDYRRSALSGSQSPEESRVPPPLPESLLGAFERLALIENIAEAQGLQGSSRTLRYSLDRISWAKQNMHSPEEIEQEQPQPNREFVQLFRSYQEQLEQQQRYDLDDLLFETVRHLKQSTELCQKLQLQFRAFFVDEYQELNEAQYRLLRFIVSDFADICAAGDPDQSVYTYRGANRHYFYQFVRDYSQPNKQAIRMAMWRNYRSPETVLEAAYHLICKQHDPQRVQTLATQTGPLFIPLSHFSNEAEEAEAIANQIQDFARYSGLSHSSPPSNKEDSSEISLAPPLETLRTGSHHYHIHSFRDIAILYRSSQQLEPLERSLQEANIPYHLTRSGSMTTHSDMQLLLGFMRSIFHEQNLSLALSLVLQYWPGLAAPLPQMYLQFAQGQQVEGIPSLLQFLDQTPIPPEQHGPFQQLILVFHRLNQAAQRSQNSRELVESFVGELCQWLPVEKLPSPPRLQDLLARATQTPNPKQLLLRLLLEQAPNTPPPLSDGVYLLPMRASKGKQFPIVIIPGCEDGILPWQEAQSSPEALAEERRLFYVACTRCQQLLWLTQANSRALLHPQIQTSPSRFLQELQPYLCML